MKKVTKNFVWVLVCAGFYLSIFAPVNAQDSKLNEVMARGRLIIGTGTGNPPFGFIDEKTKELVGFDIDLGKLLAWSIFKDETKVEFVRQTLEARWASIQSGRVDIGIQVTSVYPERALRVAFARRYIDSCMAVLVKMDSPIKNLADLNNEKYTTADSTNPAMAERTQKFIPRAKRLVFSSFTDQFMALRTDRANAAQFDLPVLKWYNKQYSGQYRILPEFTSDVIGNAMFVRIGDFPWWLAVDTIVGEMLEGVLYGKYSEIYQKWFGEDPPPPRFYLKK